jgi:hypothetical protein
VLHRSAQGWDHPLASAANSRFAIRESNQRPVSFKEGNFRLAPDGHADPAQFLLHCKADQRRDWHVILIHTTVNHPGSVGSPLPRIQSNDVIHASCVRLKEYAGVIRPVRDSDLIRAMSVDDVSAAFFSAALSVVRCFVGLGVMSHVT